MKMQAFAIYDSASQSFSAPFFRPTEALAKRDFTEMLAQPGMVSKYPEDFALHRLFSVDLDTGEILDTDAFRVVRAIDLIDKPETSSRALEEAERSEIQSQSVEKFKSA